MSLEQQIASLTQAVQSLESAIRSMGAVVTAVAAPTPAPAAAVVPAPANAAGFTAPAPAPAPMPAPASIGLTYEQVQATLAQKAQELGSPQPVVDVMVKYIPPGVKQELASVPPQHYQALLGEIATLVRAA